MAITIQARKARYAHGPTCTQTSYPFFLQEVEKTMSALLQAEEALLEAICFDFVTSSPHAEIAAIAERHDDAAVHENAWALAHDS
jgi:hypothetical protein